jgi:2-desacetyl-2-hydroxyethyl bacteriochlorophyllide A dehydrogenase
MKEESMYAWIYDSLTRSLKLVRLKMPRAGQGELIIKVKACGVCGSELHLFRTPPIRVFLRNTINNIIKPERKILGHEISGIVVESRDEKFRVGDRVAVFPKTPLGNIGDVLPGCFAEYIAVPSSSALRIPDHVSYEEAALFEPLGSALHAVRKLNTLLPMIKKQDLGKRVLIIGAGTIGLLVLNILKYMRLFDEIYVVDKIPKKLEIAKKLGADYTLTPIELSKHINTFDVVFEAVGGFAIEKTLNQVIYVLKEGGVIILMGAVEISPKVRLGVLHVKEGLLVGSYTLTYHDYIDAFNLVSSGEIKLAQLITHRFPLSDAPKAIRVALSGESVKVMLIGE